MNVLRFEMRSQLKSSAFWLFAITALLAVFMTALYPVFTSALDSVTKLLEAMPREFAEAFGLDMKNLFSYEGFYCFALSYLALFGAIASSALTISVFAREKRSKCLDFIFTKPRSRKRIFAEKLFCIILTLAAMNLVFAAVSLSFYSAHGGADKNFIIAACSLFFTQLVFMALALMYSVFAGRIRSVSGTAAAFGFGAFVLSVMAGFLEGEIILYFAPLKFFDAAKLFFEGGYDAKLVVWAAFLVIAGVLISYLRYCKSDTRSA